MRNVAEFIYLGSLLTSDSDCSKETKRIARAAGVMAEFRIIWNNKHIIFKQRLA